MAKLAYKLWSNERCNCCSDNSSVRHEIWLAKVICEEASSLVLNDRVDGGRLRWIKFLRENDGGLANHVLVVEVKLTAT